MPQPFDATPTELVEHLDSYVQAVYAELESSFLILPKGSGFVEYAKFQEAYEALKRSTEAFHVFTARDVWAAMEENSLVFLVLRTILGMSASEWASLTTTETGITVDQGTARALDQRTRTHSDYVANLAGRRNEKMAERLKAMVNVACTYLVAGPPPPLTDTVHRLAKMDTDEGLVSIRRVADLGVPYAVLLYERYLGRPFASHRDSISEQVGGVMEGAIESCLHAAHVTYRKTKRAERVPGFDQAPDFIIPDELAPRVVIEAKITNDDGTARDKITRIIHLTELSRQRVSRGESGFEVVACIDGRGFGVRREDMRRLLISVGGKVFTLRTLGSLVPKTRLVEFASGGAGHVADPN